MVQQEQRCVAKPQSADSDEKSTLDVLNAIAGNSHISQRVLATELSVALGLAHSYLKRCIRKGLVKVAQAPRRRYVYYLTPKGFREKSRLTAQYLSQSMRFFRIAKADCQKLMEACVASERRRVLLCGDGELAEIASFCAVQGGIDVVGVVQAQDFLSRLSQGADAPVLDAVPVFDVVIVTDLLDPQITYLGLLSRLPRSMVLAPALLRLSAPVNLDPGEGNAYD